MLFELALGVYAANAVKSWWKSDGSSSGGHYSAYPAPPARPAADLTAVREARRVEAERRTAHEVEVEWEREMERRGWRDLTKTFRC